MSTAPDDTRLDARPPADAVVPLPEPKTRKPRRLWPVKANELQAYLDEVNAFEADLLDEIRQSRRNAWRVAAGASVIAGISLLSAVGLALSRETETFLLLVDQVTGYTQLVRRVGEVPATEAMIHHWIERYIKARYGYSYGTIKEQYDLVTLFSSPVEREKYLKEIGVNTPGVKQIDERLHNRAWITVEKRSISIDEADRIAIVRYSTQLHHSDGREEAAQHWIAWIHYQFVDGVMPAEALVRNPMGMQVMPYQVDREAAP
jgi:type IV secretion system protein VirB8